MDHLAILRKKSGYLQKILSGEKTIESRWYVNRISPWNRIMKGETVYFKESGEPVSCKAVVEKAIQYSGLNSQIIKEILQKHGKRICINPSKHSEFLEKNKTKNYCILVFLKNPKSIQPFDIDKRGYGLMSAWISLDDIETIKK